MHLPSHVLSRHRLDACIAQTVGGAISVVQGAAGTGKSIAVNDYYGRLGHPFVYYALNGDVVSTFAFISGLSDALHEYAVGDEPLSAIASEIVERGRDTLMALNAWIREHIPAIGLTIIIDDVRDDRQIAQIGELIGNLATQTQDHVKWCFVGRRLSALPLASWLAHDLAKLPFDAELLRFSAEDTQELAALKGIPITVSDAQIIAGKTFGWPLGTSWAIEIAEPDAVHTAMCATDTFAEILRLSLNTLSAIQRDIIVAASVYPDLGAAILSALPSTHARTIRDFSNAFQSLFIYRAPFRFQPEVRHALQNSLLEDDTAYQRVTLGAAATLESIERIEDALSLLLLLQDQAEVTAILDRGGTALTERGSWTLIDRALEFIRGSEFEESAMVLALRATSESNRDHFDTAEAWFRLAIERSADASDKARIGHRFALEAMRQGRPDLVETLAEMVFEESEADSVVQLMVRGTLATAFATLAQGDRALSEIRAVLQRMRAGVSDKERARLFQQAAFVCVRCELYDEAKHYAQIAFDRAVETNAFNVAALAQTLLYEIAIDSDDDPVRALFHLRLFNRFAILSGGARLRLFALLATFSMCIENGDTTALRSLDEQLRGRELIQHNDFINETLLPDEAMRAAWAGKFQRAFRLAIVTTETETGARQLLRIAESAVFAAADRDSSGSLKLLAVASSWTTLQPIARNGRIPCLLAVAELLLGHVETACQTLARARQLGFAIGPRNEVLFQTIETLTKGTDILAESHAVRTRFSQLEDVGLGGIARLLKALPMNLISPNIQTCDS